MAAFWQVVFVHFVRLVGQSSGMGLAVALLRFPGGPLGKNAAFLTWTFYNPTFFPFCYARTLVILQQSSQKYRSPKATWNLRGIGRDGRWQNSWLKLRMITKMAQSRGWRAVLITDCYGQEPGTIKLRGPGGHWILCFAVRSGILLDPGLARCWERGGSVRFDSPGGRSCGVLVPRARRGVRGKVLALFSFYAPVSGPAFDAERRSALNELSLLLSSCPARAVLPLGGDFNAEVGFKGVGDEGCLGG